MKILEPGDPARIPPWYLRAVYTCAVCGCKCQPEDDRQVVVAREVDRESATVTCPFCGESIVLNKAEKPNGS